MKQPMLTPIANNLKNNNDGNNDRPRITVLKLDNKGRFVFPDYLLEDEDKTNLKFEIFVHNSELIVIPVN